MAWVTDELFGWVGQNQKFINVNNLKFWIKNEIACALRAKDGDIYVLASRLSLIEQISNQGKKRIVVMSQASKKLS